MMCFLLFLGRLGEIVSVKTGKVFIVVNRRREKFSLKFDVDRLSEHLCGNNTLFAVDTPHLISHIGASLLLFLYAVLNDLIDKVRTSA